ncbi:MAG: hypothetical protein HZB56_10235 [Deltaproteobacteria bacterium]|nr:hypothetical protein [Deltaproteobacteria bacterium]
MKRDAAFSALVLLLATGGSACGGGGSGGDQAPSDGACAIQWASGDFCTVVTESHCASWAAGLSGGTATWRGGGTCQQLGYDVACADGYLHRTACTSGGCSGQATCTTCAAVSSCGWCATTGQCLSGTSAGPSSGSCANWDWVSSACGGSSDPCSTSTACSGCTARSTCGWCATTSQCLTGTTSGPYAGACANWDWVSSACGGGGGGGDACSACLSACRGLPGCCTGTGCMCDSECP